MKQITYRNARDALADAKLAVERLKKTNDLTFSVDAWRQFLKAFMTIEALASPDNEDGEQERQWKERVRCDIRSDELLLYAQISSMSLPEDNNSVASKLTGITIFAEEHDGSVAAQQVEFFPDSRDVTPSLDFNSKSVDIRPNPRYVRAIPVIGIDRLVGVPKYYFGNRIPPNPSLHSIAFNIYRYLDYIVVSALDFAASSYIVK